MRLLLARGEVGAAPTAGADHGRLVGAGRPGAVTGLDGPAFGEAIDLALQEHNLVLEVQDDALHERVDVLGAGTAEDLPVVAHGALKLAQAIEQAAVIRHVGLLLLELLNRTLQAALGLCDHPRQLPIRREELRAQVVDGGVKLLVLHLEAAVLRLGLGKVVPLHGVGLCPTLLGGQLPELDSQGLVCGLDVGQPPLKLFGVEVLENFEAHHHELQLLFGVLLAALL
mmetsp:Transcript_49039/g.146512  ORF Transcript_49039/g.146512 Transcript_49039/m.146512 type:complete len:227 (+) Transcript_49039:653-1333(+)